MGERTARDKELWQERFTPFGEGVTCRGCIFSNKAPDKCSCEVYPYPKTKPDSVFLDGEPCKYRREK